MNPLLSQVNGTTLPALIFGAVLIVVGVVMCVFVRRTRLAQDPLVAKDDHARLHADRQFRRRTQVGVMLVLLGILIPVGDQMANVLAQRPLMFLGWLATVFILLILVVAMALGDWLSTVTYSVVATSRLRHERRELEEEIRRYQAVRNGHPIEDGNDHFSTGSSS
jgi:putative Mn2+ efflux pump MntP